MTANSGEAFENINLLAVSGTLIAVGNPAI
jgi:hypothetical protein